MWTMYGTILNYLPSYDAIMRMGGQLNYYSASTDEDYKFGNHIPPFLSLHCCR